jgi:hypothetical protein
MSHEVLHKKATEDYWPTIVKQARLAMRRLLDNPEGFSSEFKRLARSLLEFLEPA